MLAITSCEKITGITAIPHMTAEERRPIEARFWAKTEETPNGCWDWTAADNGWGYGAFRIAQKIAPAHRVAYALAKGPIPAGLLIRHRCNNPLCVNPAHLETGTHADNSRDAVEAGRLPTGPGSKPRKLTAEDAVAVRGAHMLGITIAESAEMWGVAPSTVNHIRLGLLWAAAIARHLDEAPWTPETPAAAP